MSLIPESVCDLKDKSVLIIWGHGNSNESLKQLAEEAGLKKSSHVILENAERLVMSAHPSSAFDIAISNILEPYSVEHSFDLLSEVVRVLKPSGSIFAKEKDSENIDKKVTALKLAGFINPVYKKGNTHYEITAKKSEFEIGSSSKLSFGKPAVWSLANSLVDDDVEFINENDLLDESDLLKPDAESLRVCGTTGKRKACKDCSCGLADELAAEKGEKTISSKTATSSCGSCYLGDAFRCASCPYLGMPAFKPGEKIQLSDRQLNPDK